MPFLSRFRSARRSRAAAGRLYAVAVARARAVAFYAELGVPDSVDGRFDMIVLHIFVLLERLRQGGEAGRRLSQALFDLMFQDMDRSLRELGVGDQAVGGRIKQMASAFYGRMRAYGEAVDARPRLIEALRRNVYRERPVAPELAGRLADHVLALRRHLAAEPLERLLAGELELDGPAAAPSPERR